MKHGALVLLFGSCAVLSGCATITNQGNRQLPLQPDVQHGPTVRAEPIYLLHYLGSNARIYEGGQQLAVHYNVILGHARHYADSATYYAYRAECERTTAQPDLQCGIAFPEVWLDTHDTHVPHTLRIVQGGREGEVIVRSRTHWWPWVWVDFLLGPAAPVGLAVDALTGKWTYNGGSIDIDAVMATPPRGTR